MLYCAGRPLGRDCRCGPPTIDRPPYRFCSAFQTSPLRQGLWFAVYDHSVTGPFRLLNILYCAEAGSIAKHKTTEAARQARVIKRHDRPTGLDFYYGPKLAAQKRFQCEARHKYAVTLVTNVCFAERGSTST